MSLDSCELIEWISVLDTRYNNLPDHPFSSRDKKGYSSL